MRLVGLSLPDPFLNVAARPPTLEVPTGKTI